MASVFDLDFEGTVWNTCDIE